MLRTRAVPDAPPPTDSDRLLQEVKSWNEARVATWLQTVNSAAYATVFINNHINGDALLECDQQALKELGITKVGDRVRILVAIKTLRSKCFGPRPLQAASSILTVESATKTVSTNLPSPNSIASVKTPNAYVAPARQQPLVSPSKVKHNASDMAESPMRSAGMSSLLSNCVKFIGDEGQTRILNIGDCRDTDMILEKALKKFGLSESITMDPSDKTENYCVFVTAKVGPARQLDDEELFQICQDPYRPERERLILKKKDTAPSILEFRQAQKIAKEQQTLLKDQANANNMNKLKKIGGFFGEMPSHIRSSSNPSSPSPLVSPSVSQHPRGPKARIKEFFGGRPPSELISSNLQDYFPEASTLILEKTVRNSIRRSQRMSVANRPQLGRRASNSSILSVSSYKSMAPPIPSVGDAWISATSLPRKSRPGSLAPSLYRSPSASSRADTIRSKKSLRTYRPDSEVDPIFNKRAGSVTSLSSNGSDKTYKDENGVSSAEHSDVDDTYADEADEFELPDYLKDKLAQTEDEDDEMAEMTLRARSMAKVDGSNVTEQTLVASISAEDTGPSSWIKGTHIGQGSFGSVVLGMNALTGELMAVKQVDLPRSHNSDRDTASRKTEMLDALQREIALLRDLQHDNIVQYLGSNSDNTHLNIFLEYVPGGSVTEMLTKYGAFKEPLVRQFVRQILTGLNYLHEREIIHRDIKGGNILVDNKGVIKISDFGISKKVEPTMLSIHESALKANHRQSLQGSVFWMAPEVVKQTQYTRKADIWSLGCLIVEMFTGQHPYPDLNQMQAIFKIGGSDSAPDIPADLSTEGKEFLQKTFEMNHLARPSAAELLAHPFCHASV